MLQNVLHMDIILPADVPDKFTGYDDGNGIFVMGVIRLHLKLYGLIGIVVLKDPFSSLPAFNNLRCGELPVGITIGQLADIVLIVTNADSMEGLFNKRSAFNPFLRNRLFDNPFPDQSPIERCNADQQCNDGGGKIYKKYYRYRRLEGERLQ